MQLLVESVVTLVFLFSYAKMNSRIISSHMLDNYSKFDRYFRTDFQHALMRHQLRFVEGHSMSAEDRYHSFTRIYPGIEQYIAQKYIVSYLGITPQFLSKIKRTPLRNTS